MKSYAYLNGKIVPEDKARVSVFDRGLNYGDGVFETIRCCCAKPQLLKEHLKRLKSGARSLGIRPIKALEDAISNGAPEELLVKNGFAKGPAALKIIVTRGEQRRGHAPQAGLIPTVIMTASPVDSKSIARYRAKGVRAVLIDGYGPALPFIKTLNYLPNVLGKIAAKRGGADEGIFIHPDSRVSEGTATSVFIISGKALKTPPVLYGTEKGVLPGVVRGEVLALAHKAGLKATETEITLDDLISCDEAFLTNSIWGLVPLVKAGNTLVADGAPGQKTRRIQELFGQIDPCCPW